MNFLNLGCGSNYHKDWLNIDFVSNNKYVQVHNLLRGIPVKDSEMDVVYHSHVLEHFTKKDGIKFIEECYRVLKKNGIIRIAIPDLETIAKEYLRNLALADKGNKEAENNYEWVMLEMFDQTVRNVSGGEMKNYLFKESLPNEAYVYKRVGYEGEKIRKSFLNKKTSTKKEDLQHKKSFILLLKRAYRRLKVIINKSPKSKLTKSQLEAISIGEFRLGGEVHQWMYDRYSLKKLLLDSGFNTIKICKAEESSIENWSNYNLDMYEGKVRKPDSIFIEAIK